MDGLIRINKHPGPTSHDIVAEIRRIFGIRKAGHCGTLDPGASGVLLIAVGRATRLTPYLSGHEKSYRGEIRTGFSTDTYDASGRPTSRPSDDIPDRSDVERIMRDMEGEHFQTPPPYSAKKVDGVRLYKLARAGRPVHPRPVPVAVRSFRLLEYAPPILRFETICSAGTYVRSLAHDLGLRLGCGAHLIKLVRTASGPFALDSCASLVDLREAAAAGKAERLFIPLEDMVPGLTAVYLDAAGAAKISQGAGTVLPPASPPLMTDPGAALRLIGPDGLLIGLGRLSDDGTVLRPFLVLRPAPPAGTRDP